MYGVLDTAAITCGQKVNRVKKNVNKILNNHYNLLINLSWNSTLKLQPNTYCVLSFYSTIKLNLSGGLLGWFANKMTSVYTSLFQNSLRKKIETTMTDTIQHALDNLPHYQRNEDVKVSPYCWSTGS